MLARYISQKVALSPRSLSTWQLNRHQCICTSLTNLQNSPTPTANECRPFHSSPTALLRKQNHKKKPQRRSKNNKDRSKSNQKPPPFSDEERKLFNRYRYDDGYDPYDHMTNNPDDFYTKGNGGFGYDTSHIKKDDPHSKLFNHASEGNLSEVKRIVERITTNHEKNKVINHARRWTEVEYKMSGFAQDWEWFDITPVAAAASKGHHEVVRYLLEQGADPTLSGCPFADTYWDAFQAARGKRCIALLNAVKPFWNRANYAGHHYKSTARKKFTNAPSDLEGMLKALGSV